MASTGLIDIWKFSPSRSEHEEVQRQLKHELIKSLRNKLEQWWVAKREEMRKVETINNSRQIFELIKETSIKSPAVSNYLGKRRDYYSLSFQVTEPMGKTP